MKPWSRHNNKVILTPEYRTDLNIQFFVANSVQGAEWLCAILNSLHDADEAERWLYRELRLNTPIATE